MYLQIFHIVKKGLRKQLVEINFNFIVSIQIFEVTICIKKDSRISAAPSGIIFEI